MKKYIEPDLEVWPEIIKRPVFENAELKNQMYKIINDVKNFGDEALRKYTSLFDGNSIKQFKVSTEDILQSENLLSAELKQSIDLAYNNIVTFHSAQLDDTIKIETMEGVSCWRKPVAIEKVGLYVPGGSAPLFSTLLMLAIPAKLAGCREIIVCTPPDKEGKINSTILYIAKLLKLKDIFKVGGAQAIAAMAYGTESVPKVFKIFGPGNQFVTAAKQIVNSDGISIDMPAGPSEVAIYADHTCNPLFVAADLLSQAEHGLDSQVILIATSAHIVKLVDEALLEQIEKLSRKEIIIKCLEKSVSIIINDIDEAFKFINEYAAEHLIIASDNALLLADKIINAGSVFLGHYSPESVGDYASGTNHTLPTNAHAKAYSGVSVDSFVKKITFQQLSQKGINNIGKAVEYMAMAEGLDAHKNAVSIRLKSNHLK